MFLHIYSLDKSKFYREAQSVSVKTSRGEITILDHHRPLITPLVKGPMVIVEANGEKTTIDAEGGILEVRPGSEVNILAD